MFGYLSSQDSERSVQFVRRLDFSNLIIASHIYAQHTHTEPGLRLQQCTVQRQRPGPAVFHGRCKVLNTECCTETKAMIDRTTRPTVLESRGCSFFLPFQYPWSSLPCPALIISLYTVDSIRFARQSTPPCSQHSNTCIIFAPINQSTSGGVMVSPRPCGETGGAGGCDDASGPPTGWTGQHRRLAAAADPRQQHM